jgi:hypothetical protein
VENPEQLDLADPIYLHVFRCAECTRDLQEFRRIREARPQQKLRSSGPDGVSGGQSPNWKSKISALLAMVFAPFIRLWQKLKLLFR